MKGWRTALVAVSLLSSVSGAAWGAPVLLIAIDGLRPVDVREAKDKKINIYELKNIVNSEVDTPDGKATLKEIYVTELGYIMAKVYYPKKGVYVNHKIGYLKNLLKSDGLNLVSEWTEHIVLEEKLVK